MANAATFDDFNTSGNLRQERNKPEPVKYPPLTIENGREISEEATAGRLNEMKKWAREKSGLNKLNKKVKAVTNAAQQATGQMLKSAWLNIIPSFGLTLIYINAHTFLRAVIPDFFCKLGEEWVPKEIKTAGGEAAEAAGKTAFIVEAAGLMLIDLLLLFMIIFAFAQIMIIVNFWQANVWDKAKMIYYYWSFLGNLGLEALSAIGSLF